MSQSFQIDYREISENEPNGSWCLYRITEQKFAKPRTFTSRAGNIIADQPPNFIMHSEVLKELVYVLAIAASKHDDEQLNPRRSPELSSRSPRPDGLRDRMQQKLKGKRHAKG